MLGMLLILGIIAWLFKTGIKNVEGN